MVIQNVEVNYFAVLVAAVASMIVGSVWYSQVLFGKVWVRLSGKSQKDIDKAKQRGMGKLYLMAFIGALVMAYVLAHFIRYLEVTNVVGVIQLVFWLWLGLIATVSLGAVLWDGKPWGLYVLNVVYQLVSLIIIGIVLVLWP